MKPIRTLIVDDEELCRRGVRLLLSEDGDFELLGECASGSEAIDKINTLHPHLVFLDIQMPEITGFDVLKNIAPEAVPYIIFVTAYDEFAVKAFDVHALDYILKPYSKTRFSEALARAKETIGKDEIDRFGRSLTGLLNDSSFMESFHGKETSPIGSNDDVLERILIKERDGLKFIEVDDIDWIEGTDYYANLHCGAKSYLYRESLKNLEHRLPSSRFVRVHKSAIVNLESIQKISTETRNELTLILKSGQMVNVSRRRKKPLMKLFEDKFGLKNR